MEIQNQYTERYRRESYILEFNRNRSSMNPTVIEGSPDNLKGHLLQLRGNENGVYFDSHHREVPSRLTILQRQIDDLELNFKSYVQDRLNLGEKKPTSWPVDLQDRKDILEAKLIIAKEEIAWLEAKLIEAQQDKLTREKRPVQPKFWGAGRLRDGILVEFCGWDVTKNSDGILAIDDKTSPYDTMEIWKLKSAVLNPLDEEHRLRQKQEVKAALAENRPRKAVHYPEPPTYDAKHDNIEYPADYDPSIIRKLKHSVT